MDMIGQTFEIRKGSGIGLDGIEFAAPRALPFIIDIHIAPAVLNQAGPHHGVRRRKNLVLIDRGAPAIPAIPTHRRREHELIAYHDLKGPICLSQGILRMKRYLEGALLLSSSRDLSGGRVQGQARRQSLR